MSSELVCSRCKNKTHMLTHNTHAGMSLCPECVLAIGKPVLRPELTDLERRVGLLEAKVFKRKG